MDFYAVLDQVVDLLRQRGRVTYRALKLQFKLDDDQLEALKDELLFAHPQVVDDAGRGLLWTGTPAAAPAAAAPALAQDLAPLSYTLTHLAEKILTSRAALEGERKQVTVLFADLKGSMELLAERDPEEARHLLDPVLDRMMAAVHQFEGTVNQVMGDGIMALFGAPLAHEDHAVRACYAALRMQEAVRQYATEVQRAHGVPIHMRVGLNAGEVVVRSIGSDLHMDYTAVGQTTHLAARMEQMAMPGSILITPAVLGLVEGFVQVKALGAVPIRGLRDPVEVYEVTDAGVVRSRLQAAAARGLTRFVGRQPELETLQQALAQAYAGHGQVVALVGEAGVGKSRLVYEVVHSHRTQGWMVLESASVSYGKATPYFPVVDLLKRYCHVEARDDPRTMRAKVTGQILTLDEALQATIPALLALLDALPADSSFLTLDPPLRRQHTLDGLKRLLMRESQVQPPLLVFEDLHWIDTETQALLDSLVESVPMSRLLLLVNYRPEYQHGWGNKTFYRQLRLDPLPPASADEFLQALLGDDPSLAPLKPLLIARTGGNPFFLEESVRTLVETGTLVGPPGAYRLAQPLALATTSGAFDVQVHAQNSLSVAYYAAGDFRQALDVSQRMIAGLTGDRLSERFGLPIFPGLVGRGYAALCLAELGDFAEGAGIGEEAIRLAETVAQPNSMIIVLYCVGLCYRRQGGLHKAIPMLERSLALSQSADIPIQFPMTASLLSAAYALAGRAAEALPLLDQMLERLATDRRMLLHALVQAMG
jgi:class 3 adenylate cyclase/tetratricopeptide (TPR) repeat protein